MTGPKPKRSSARVPQLEVDSTDPNSFEYDGSYTTHTTYDTRHTHTRTHTHDTHDTHMHTTHTTHTQLSQAREKKSGLPAVAYGEHFGHDEARVPLLLVPGDGLEAQPVPVHAPALLALLGSSSVGLDRLSERRFLLRIIGLRARELCVVVSDMMSSSIKSTQ
jgi:hypothetical protein